jgi:mRNA interferase MazF
MGQYVRGDVILALVPVDDSGNAKTRPAVVIGTGENRELFICPVSSKPPSDAPSVPIGLDDFAEGGLDLFCESYVMTSRVSTIRSGDVTGKRGRLTRESIAAIGRQVQEPVRPVEKTVLKQARSRTDR